MVTKIIFKFTWVAFPIHGEILNFFSELCKYSSKQQSPVKHICQTAKIWQTFKNIGRAKLHVTRYLEITSKTLRSQFLSFSATHVFLLALCHFPCIYCECLPILNVLCHSFLVSTTMRVSETYSIAKTHYYYKQLHIIVIVVLSETSKGIDYTLWYNRRDTGTCLHPQFTCSLVSECLPFSPF